MGFIHFKPFIRLMYFFLSLHLFFVTAVIIAVTSHTINSLLHYTLNECAHLVKKKENNRKSTFTHKHDILRARWSTHLKHKSMLQKSVADAMYYIHFCKSSAYLKYHFPPIPSNFCCLAVCTFISHADFIYCRLVSICVFFFFSFWLFLPICFFFFRFHFTPFYDCYRFFHRNVASSVYLLYLSHILPSSFGYIFSQDCMMMSHVCEAN